MLIFLAIFSGLSFFLSFYGLVLIYLKKGKSKFLFMSIVLDTGMCIVGFFLIIRAPAAQREPCKNDHTKITLFTIGLCLLLRQIHVLAISMYVCCCMPCLMCPEGCCIKRYLLRIRPVSQKSLQGLDNWTWVFEPPRETPNGVFRDLPKTCQICYEDFQRGEMATLLPCQFNR